jgi:hypothetical protein
MSGLVSSTRRGRDGAIGFGRSLPSGQLTDFGFVVATERGLALNAEAIARTIREMYWIARSSRTMTAIGSA